MKTITINRREFMRLAAIGSGALALAACGPKATVVELAAKTAEDKIMVGDVINYARETDAWTGLYGWVQLKLHEGRVNGEAFYFIRTDASTSAFAEENGLVYVPLLASAKGAGIANTLYLFDGDQMPVMLYQPGDADYASLCQVVNVAVGDGSVALDSAEAVEKAAADGKVTLAEQDLFVNYPVVKWPGGELAVDAEKVKTLGGGQLIEAVDTNRMTVKFKMHQCYPGSRYILTDTSSEPMGPMMSVPATTPTQKLMDLGGTDEIWVFGNGIEGSGVMGFQPAIFDNKAGEPAWSPFWNHFTLTWNDGVEPRLLKSSAEIRAALTANELTEWNGVPDSHPNGFVVNCPAVILSPNDFEDSLA